VRRRFENGFERTSLDDVLTFLVQTLRQARKRAMDTINADLQPFRENCEKDLKDVNELNSRSHYIKYKSCDS